MPSSPSALLNVELQAQGENLNTWGGLLNGTINRLTEAIAQITTVPVTSPTTTLTSTNYVANQARSAGLLFTGVLTADTVVIAPSQTKIYLISNATTGGFALTINTLSGTPLALRNGSFPYFVYCDGTNFVTLDLPLNQIRTAIANVAMGGFNFTGLAAATATGQAVTFANRLDQLAAATSPISAPDAVSSLNLTNLAQVIALIAGAGPVNSGQVRATINDTTPTYLLAKLAAAAGLEITLLNAGASEQVQIARRVNKTDFTGSHALATTDNGELLSFTGSSSATWTSPAQADGWFSLIRNVGTGTITLPTIDGGAPTLGPGQSATLQSTGSVLSFATLPTGFRNLEIFSTSGTFTPKPGQPRYFIQLGGAGGGAGNPSSGSRASGGGMGGFCMGFVTITSAQTVTIGSGGTGSSTPGTGGTAGGASSFGSLATSNGGGGGGGSGGDPGLGGSATMSGGIAIRGSAGYPGQASAGALGCGVGAPGPFGGAGAYVAGAGVDTNRNGVFGAGGAACDNAGTAGNGGGGFCFVMW